VIKPINLGLSERQNLLLQRARLKLDYTQRARIDKSYDTNLQRRALLLIGDAYDRLVEASDDAADQASWRERQYRVESELKRILLKGP